MIEGDLSKQYSVSNYIKIHSYKWNIPYSLSRKLFCQSQQFIQLSGLFHLVIRVCGITGGEGYIIPLPVIEIPVMICESVVVHLYVLSLAVKDKDLVVIDVFSRWI